MYLFGVIRISSEHVDIAHTRYIILFGTSKNCNKTDIGFEIVRKGEKGLIIISIYFFEEILGFKISASSGYSEAKI